MDNLGLPRLHTTAEVAAWLRCSPVTVSRLAKRHGIGMLLGGRVGRRFTDMDVETLVAALTPPAAEPDSPRRRRRRRAPRGGQQNPG